MVSEWPALDWEVAHKLFCKWPAWSWEVAFGGREPEAAVLSHEAGGDRKRVEAEWHLRKSSEMF